MIVCVNNICFDMRINTHLSMSRQCDWSFTDRNYDPKAPKQYYMHRHDMYARIPIRNTLHGQTYVHIPIQIYSLLPVIMSSTLFHYSTGALVSSCAGVSRVSRSSQTVGLKRSKFSGSSSHHVCMELLALCTVSSSCRSNVWTA